MTIESEIAGLTQATTDLLAAVNVRKATLDSKVTEAAAQVDLAAAQATSSSNSATASAASETTAKSSANLAQTKASEAAASALSAASSASSALTAKNSAEAAAEASGSILFYDTYSAANAAVGGMTTGQVVEVFADETKSGHRTRYRKEGGVLVFKLRLSTGKTVYLDPEGGNDSNSGTSPDAPVLTWTAANALLQAGDTLRIRGGTRQHVYMNVNKSYVTVDTYGQQGKAFIDGSRKVPAASWVQDPNNAGVWYADFTHSTTPDSVQNGFCVWEERLNATPLALVPRWTGADIAANRTYLLTNRDHFTCHRVGSTAKDPRSDTYSTQYRYYVCPPNGENPSTGGIEYYVAEFGQVFNISTGCIARNIIVQRTGAKDLAGHNQNKANLLEDCEFNDGFMHGWVGGAIALRRIYAKGRRIGGDYTNFGGGGLHIYNDSPTQIAFLEDCEVDGYGKNYYSHAGTFTSPDHNTVFCRNLKSRNAQDQAFAIGSNTKRGVHINGFESFNDAGGFQLPVGSTVKNFRLRIHNGRNSAFRLTGASGGEVYAENGSVVFSGTPVGGSQGGTLFGNQQASTDGNASHVVTLRMKNVTKVGGAFPAGIYFRQVNVIATDCVLGEIDASGNTVKPFNTLTASLCQLNWYRRSLEEIRAIEPLVGTDCIVPWVQQPMIRTISGSDLGYIDCGASIVMTNAADLTHVTFNTARNLVVGDYIKIINYNGSGSDHLCRLVELRSTNNWTVDPAVPSYFSSYKTCHFAYFNRKILPSTMSVTSVFSDDGTQAYFSNVSDIYQGMTVYFGAIGRRAPIGPRKIVSLSGQTATLDRPVVWNAVNGGAVTYAAFGATTNNPRPSVLVSFGFPIRPVLTDGTFGTPFSIDLANPASAANVTGHENNSSNIGGRFNLSLRTGSFKLLLSDGTPVDTGQIKHQIGEIDAGFYPLGPSDVLSVTPVCYVEDYDAQYASDPVLSGSAALKPGTVLAGLGIGARI